MKKSGASGNRGAQGFNFLTEPVNSTTREMTATANYTGKRLQLTGGYIGSFFANAHEALANDSSQPQISLPPDNSAHQVHLAAAYALGPTTRATFKASYGIAIQNETFFTEPTLPGNTRGNLGGQVNTTLVRLGLSARPMPKLAGAGKLRYEDRDDRTDIAQYITASASHSGFNLPFSRTTVTGDLEAVYRLPNRYRVIGRLKQENWNRNKPVLRQASFRDETYETSYGIELRRSLLNKLGGHFLYPQHQERLALARRHRRGDRCHQSGGPGARQDSPGAELGAPGTADGATQPGICRRPL